MTISSRTLLHVISAFVVMALAVPCPVDGATSQRVKARKTAQKPVAANNTIIALPLNPTVPAAQRLCAARTPSELRARLAPPVAVPITWKEMETIDAPNDHHIRDAAELVKRPGSKALAGWARADQTLPDL